MIAPTLRTAVLVAVTAVSSLVVGGCTGGENGATEDLSDLTPLQALDRARDAVASSDGFRFTLSHISGATKLSGGLVLQRASGFVMRPGDMKLTAEANFGRAFVRTDAIVIGTSSWMTNPLTGTWAVVPPEDSPFGFFDPVRVAANIIEQVDNPVFSETAGTGGSVKIEGTIPSSAFQPLVGVVADTVVDVKLVLDAKTFHLLEARVRGVLQDGDAESAERLIELSGYDEDFQISPPI